MTWPGASPLKLTWDLPESKGQGSQAAQVGSPRSTGDQALADPADWMWETVAASLNGKMKGDQ